MSYFAPLFTDLFSQGGSMTIKLYFVQSKSIIKSGILLIGYCSLV